LQQNNTYTYHLRLLKTESATPFAVQPLDAPGRRRLPPLLRRAWYSLNQAFRRRVSHTGVTPDQFTVMRTLIEGDPAGISQRELSHLMSSDPNTIAALVERMERMELVERVPHETDGRALRIRLLPAGNAVYEDLRVVALHLQSEALQVLPEQERERFLDNLSQVANACRAAADNSPRRQPASKPKAKPAKKPAA